MSTPPPGPVVQVVGRARTADRVTATARGLQRSLTLSGRPGRVVASHRDPGCEDIAEVTDLAAGEVVVLHTVDGGEDLGAVLPRLEGRGVTLVHHGSSAGSDRRVLRALRGTPARSLAADPGARDELQSLGFGGVARLDPAVLDGALDDVDADPASLETLARHPGPLVLSVGPCEPNQSLELLLDAFAVLITMHRPSATLALCGPASPWYLATLRRRITTAGLVACELLSPATDAQVVARLRRAAVVVALHPVGLDPFLREAVRIGVPVVAPRVAATSGLPPGQLVPVPARVQAADLAAALSAATEPTLALSAAPPVDRRRVGRDVASAFGLG
jgi:hypothetical protein